MEKWMCFGSIGVAAIMLLVFLVDLFVGMPFSNGTTFDDSPFFIVNLVGVVASGILGYLGWNALRDVR